MDTLATIKKESISEIAINAYPSTPKGHFEVTATVLGLVTIYLLKGELGQEQAPIVGRVELDSNRLRYVAYRGDSLKGGDFTSIHPDGLRETIIKLAL